MQYGKPYTYFINKPGGSTNLLYGSLLILSSMVIPVLGQVVLLGYQAEAAEDLKDDPEIEAHPDFDWNKLVPYLSRGVWPFLMQFLGSLIVAGLIFLAMGIGFAAGYATQEPAVGVVVGVVLYIPLLIVGSMLLWPLTLHAQLSKGFYFGPAVRFTTQIVKRTGGQLFMAMLVHLLISIPLSILGLLLCLVGLFPAAMIQFMAQEHYMIQIYRIYLDEGGEPIGGLTDQLEMDEM